MHPRLRLCKSDDTTAPSKQARESFPFPSEAAARLTPSAIHFARSGPLPFPLSHPENGVFPAVRSATGQPLAPDDITTTDDLVRNLFGEIDRIQSGITAVSSELDSYQFPGAARDDDDDDDRPFAA